MASAQAIAMNDKEKEMVVAMVEQAKSVGKTNNMKLGAVNQQANQNSAVVYINNSTPAKINFNQNLNWAGSVIGTPYPTTITAMSSASFTHAAQPIDGSKGAVVYFGSNKDGIPSGWLLAWFAPAKMTPTNPNRVHVECGPSAKYGSVDWDVIKARLDVADSYNNHFDPVTHTTIAAEITPGGSFAAIGANFGVF
ncbi:hypothetical protein SOVF_175870 [Spinacia oleracea]|nr:hypothetical protein SOVF_175870 [Spinacia oleracea]